MSISTERLRTIREDLNRKIDQRIQDFVAQGPSKDLKQETDVFWFSTMIPLGSAMDLLDRLIDESGAKVT